MTHQKQFTVQVINSKLKDFQQVIQQVIQLGDQNSSTLGLLTYEAYENAANKENILIYLNTKKEVVGYLLYYISGKKNAGIDHQTFENYYKNSVCGFAIFLGKTYRFKHPVKLNILREQWPNFNPPQSYRYIRENELDLLKQITNYDILSVSQKEKIYQTELLHR